MADDRDQPRITLRRAAAADDLDLPSESVPDADGSMTRAQLPAPDEADVPEDLGKKVARGAKWSMVGNIITRAGSFLTGIVVANLVDEKAIGVFAVALVVGQMVLTFIDMGLGADLMRGTEEEMEAKAPTTASLGLIFCTIGAILLLLGADLIAGLLKVPDSATLIRVYAGMVFIGGLAIVPQAVLMRRLDQRSFMAATVTNFVLSTSITLGLLIGTGIGVLALPIGALIGMAAEVALFFVLAGRTPQFGWDKELVGPALGFGMPVAGANVLQVLLSSVDRMVVAPVLGEARLGFYTLAGNIANWPVSVFGLVVRAIALPAFAHTKPRPRDPVLTLGTQLTWLISFPVGLMLALFAHDVVLFVYNPNYMASIPLLATLGIYGAIRVLFDTFTGYLYARGDSRGVLHANIIWTIALFGLTWVGAHFWGSEGAAMAQVATVLLVALPLFLWTVQRAGSSVVDMGKALLPATLAAVPAAIASVLLSRLVDSLHLTGIVRLDAMIGLAVGGFSFLGVYIPLVFGRVKRGLAVMRTSADEQADPASA